MTPKSEPETDTRLDASITASGGESEGTALSVGSCVFQRSFTRCRWLLDPLPLELTSQVETDQPLLSCASTLGVRTDRPHSVFLQVGGRVPNPPRCVNLTGLSCEVVVMSEMSRIEVAAPQRPAAAVRRAGFDEFYAAELPRLVALARGLCPAHLAEDVAQEAMLVAYRRWREVIELERPDLWVRRTCANLAVSQFRRRMVELR